jgi:hypothetical protein
VVKWRDMIAHVALLIASALAAQLMAATGVSPASGASPSPTPVPMGIRATFVGLAERGGVTYVTFAQGSSQTTAPLAQPTIIRERAIGGDWKAVPYTALHEGAPIVVFLDAGSVFQIDALYAQVTTRFVLVKNGYGVTPSGKIYTLIGRARSVGETLPQGAYVQLRVDPASEVAFDLVASRTPFPETSTTPKVTVTVEVLAPVNTPPTDVVYMSTDALSWTPNAIRMAPLPGGRWTVTLSLTGGSLLKYKYTRGSWQTDERDLAGNEVPNRSLVVNAKGPAQSVNDVVARWADRSS